MQNIEFKAELRDIHEARTQLRVLGAQFIGTLEQTDTYYKLADGRLKKREAPGEPVEWLFYHRPDRITPKMCNYTILSDEQAKLRWGTHSLRQWLVVKKTRDLWMLDDVRIHLDQVEDIGTFIEFEAMVTKRCNVKECHMAMGELREVFESLLGEAISVSYSDLMEQGLAEKT